MYNKYSKFFGKIFNSKSQLVIDLNTFKEVDKVYENVSFRITERAIILLDNDTGEYYEYPWDELGDNSSIEWHLDESIFTCTLKTKGINVSYILC